MCKVIQFSLNLPSPGLQLQQKRFWGLGNANAELIHSQLTEPRC